MIFKNVRTCPNCGAEVAKDVNFCGECGARMPGGLRRCGKCGFENRGDSVFCGKCGSKLDESSTASVQRDHWARRMDEFAVRVVVDDLQGLLRRGLNVDMGTNAMILEHGATRGMMPPGLYTMDNILQRARDWVTGAIPAHVTALLVDVTPADLEFHLGGRFTSDPLPIGLTLRLQVDIGDPGKFLLNMLSSRERLSKEDVRQYLYPEITAVADRWLRQHSLQQLADDPAQLSRLEIALEEALRTTFAQSGLHFIQVRTAELNLEPFEAIQGKYAEANLLDKDLAAEKLMAEVKLRKAEQETGLDLEAQARLEDLRKEYDLRRAESNLDFQRRYLDVQKNTDLLTLADETRKVELEERRVDLYQRMRQAALSDRMNDVRSTDDFERFMDEIDREKLLREHERQELLRAWDEEKHDHERARAHLLARLDLEQGYELRIAELKLRQDLSEQDFEFNARLERRRVEESFYIQLQRAESQIKVDRVQADFRREQQKLDELDDRIRLMEDAKAQALARREELEADRLEAEFGLLMLEKMDAQELRTEHQRALNQLEIETRQLELRLRTQQQEVDLRLREMRERHDQELESKKADQDFELSRIESLKSFGQAGAMVLANPENARMIKELGETEAMKEMSPEAILARVSERSPEAAKALAELMASKDSASRDEMKTLYDRMYTQLQDQLEKQRETAREQGQLQKDMYETGLQTAAQIARDVAQASNKGNSNPQVIIASPGGGMMSYPTGGSGGGADTGPVETRTCVQCGRQVEVNKRFCPFCGKKFEGEL